MEHLPDNPPSTIEIARLIRIFRSRIESIRTFPTENEEEKKRNEKLANDLQQTLDWFLGEILSSILQAIRDIDGQPYRVFVRDKEWIIASFFEF